MTGVIEVVEYLPVAEARTGSADAWDALFKRYRLPLYAYLWELLHDDQATLDAVQETFLQAFRHLSNLRDDAKFGGWLFAIAHQKALQHFRRTKRSPFEETEIPESEPAPIDSPDEFLIREEEKEKFYSALNQIPLPQRSALLLHFIEDFSLEEISKITGATIGTVKSRIFYGKKALKELYENT